MPTMSAAILTLSRYVLVEARRSALPWLACAAALGALALSAFLAQVAIVESAALQTTACAAMLRLCAVFLVATHVVASVVREANDKGVELLLALPISRSAWYLGKLCGFTATAIAVATLAALPLAFLAPPAPLLAWWLGLCAESALVAAMALFFAAALGQTASAIAGCAGLYLLGRALGAMQAIAAGPLADEDGPQHALRALLDAFALLLPRLDSVARGDWLLYGAPGIGELLRPLAGVALYFLLLAAAGLFDASRRNL